MSKRGRKSAVTKEEILQALLQFKSEIGDSRQTVPGKTSQLWIDIASKLQFRKSPVSVYTHVIMNRHNCWDALGFISQVNLRENIEIESGEDIIHRQLTESEKDSEDETVHLVDAVVFDVKLNKQEWSEISPETVITKCRDKYRRGFRTRQALKENWTNVMNRCIWQSYQKPCCWIFKRNHVSITGENYIVLEASCKNCHSEIKLTLNSQPQGSDDVVFKGVVDFDSENREPCAVNMRKRPLKGIERREIVAKLQNVSALKLHMEIADKEMDFGDTEPAHIPSMEVLRKAKSEAKLKIYLNVNPVVAISKAKNSPEFEKIIHDIGYDKFFVHYWDQHQVDVFNAYGKARHSVLCIDSTGSVAWTADISGKRISSKLQLYVGVISVSERSVPVVQMVSERHNTNAICFWLKEWIRDGALVPNEVVCDFSMALLGAIVQAFTGYATLKHYLRQCSLILHELSNTVPMCYVRIDVAHFIKMICRWKCFAQEKHRTVKDFYVRCAAILMQCEDFADFMQIVTAVFWCSLSETDGVDENEKPVQSETSREWLVKKISKADVRVPDEIIQTCHEVNEDCNLDVLDNVDNTLPEINETYLNIEQDAAARGGGNRVSCFYLPEFAKALKKLCMSAAVWSAVMLSTYSENQHSEISNTASSAGVESYFRDVKTLLFKSNELPLRVDEFVLRHITVARGGIKIATAKLRDVQVEEEIPEFDSNDAEGVTEIDGKFSKKKQQSDVEQQATFNSESGSNKNGTHCVACLNGDYPTGAHKCAICKRNVHVLPGCSIEISGEVEGYGERRICSLCSVVQPVPVTQKRSSESDSKGNDKSTERQISYHHWKKQSMTKYCDVEPDDVEPDDVEPYDVEADVEPNESEVENIDEGTAECTWNRKSTLRSKRTPRYSFKFPSSVYQLKDPRQTFVRNPINFKLLQNGTGRGSVRIYGKRLKLFGTCALDSVLHAMVCCYIESGTVRNAIKQNSKESILSKLIHNVATKGPTLADYQLRADFVASLYKREELEMNPPSAIGLTCEKVVSDYFLKLRVEFPSYIESQTCSSSSCPERYVTRHISMFTVI